VYTPTSFIDILPDHYKQKPIMLYDPRRAPLLNQYRMIVPRTRAVLEVVQFTILLGLYLGVMYYGKKNELQHLEMFFIVFSLGWILDQIASVLEHGMCSSVQPVYMSTNKSSQVGLSIHKTSGPFSTLRSRSSSQSTSPFVLRVIAPPPHLSINNHSTSSQWPHQSSFPASPSTSCPRICSSSPFVL
jgi:hypothetical protein